MNFPNPSPPTTSARTRVQNLISAAGWKVLEEATDFQAVGPLSSPDKAVFIFNGVEFERSRDSNVTGLVAGPGWRPHGNNTPQHFGAIGDGVADDTAAYQAALDYGRLKAVTGVQGCTYLITSELSLKTGTYWDHNGSKLLASGVASSSFFALWKPENGANRFRVVGQDIDCNNVAGMIGFILRVGSHDGIVDGFNIRNFPHEKDGVDGGRGFVIESQATVLTNSNLIVTNGNCKNGYMGFAFQSGDGLGKRHNVTISNINVDSCNVMYWTVGNTANYPHDPDEMQVIIDNINGHNCGKAGPYTNGGGAVVSDRGCNIKHTNIVLHNDAAYGSIPAAWHGNGARLTADITFYGTCTNFWDFRPYKEADSNPAAENTVQDSEFYGRLHGTCTDIAYIGSATGSFVIDTEITGIYDTVSSGAVVSENLRANPRVYFDVRNRAENTRISGYALAISAATFSAYSGRIRRFSEEVASGSRTVILNSIPDDGVATVTIPAMLATVITIAPSGNTHPAACFSARSVATVFSRVVWQSAGTTSSIQVAGLNNTVLTGTTGTDGNITLSIVGNLLYLENRSGSPATYAVTINGLT